MAEFNYSDYVAKMAQRKGPMHETDSMNNDMSQLDNSYLDQLDLTTKIYESETIYEYGSDGNCYRIDDEGNRDVVSDSYCQRYAGQGVRESDLEETDMKEAMRLNSKEYYQILDTGTDEWHDDFRYVGEIYGGSTVGEIGDHMFMAPTGPGAFVFVNISDVDLDTMVKPSMSEGELEEVIDDTDVEVTDDEFSSTDFDKEPSKKDIKAAEKEFNFSVPKADDSVADSALEKAKQIIKIKVGKILSQPKGQRSKSTDLVVLKQFIQRPDIKKAFKARGLDVMDFVKDVIA